MPLTPAERSALRWLVAIILIGSGAKVYRQWHNAGAVTPSASEALRLQLAAVDSAQQAGKRRDGKQRSGRPRRASSRAVADQRDATAQPVVMSDMKSAGDRPTLPPVDLDVADASSLERLPRIGPSLAARIVADRAAKGPFGSLQELQRVRGIGPKLAQQLTGHVTFSGTPRQSAEQR
jgi:competence protein ComEA